MNQGYRLKNKKANKTLVFLVLEKDRQRQVVSTGISVIPKFWDDKTQLLREHRECPEGEELNKKFKEITERASDAFAFYNEQDINPTVAQIKTKFIALKDEPKKGRSRLSFWDCFEEFIAYQQNEINSRTVIDYDKALRKHLKETEKISGITVSFNALKNNGGFMQEFEKYLKFEALNAKGKKGFKLNSIGKQTKNIKSFLNWCFKRNYCIPFDMAHIKNLEEDVQNIYLNEAEIETLLHVNLEDEELVKVRDLFVIGCETGLRFSDYRRFRPEHFANNYVTIHQRKTSVQVKIPISSRLKKMLEKYSYSPPNFDENELTEFNTKIKLICKKAGLTEPIVFIQKLQGKTVESFVPKYELVSSHTCRRSFCTNWFLKKTVPARAIMAVSGHKTEKSFMKYIKLGSDEIIKQYESEFMK
jgi:integrase